MVKIVKPEDEQKPNAFLPVMGMLLAVGVGVMAYFAAPILLDLVAQQMGRGDFNNRLGVPAGTTDYTGTTIHYAFSVLLWMGLFGILMFMVAAAIGEDPSREEAIIHPRADDIKGLKKYAAHLEKEQEKRKKLIEQKRKQDAKKAKKNR